MEQAPGTLEHAGETEGVIERFLPIPIDSLDFRAHELDLYLSHRDRARPALYRAAGTEFTEADAARLAEQHIRFLHIHAHQHSVYRQALAERLDRQFSDPAASSKERARVVRTACARMIEEVLLLPDQPEPVAAIKELAGQFSRWSESDPAAFAYMLEMSDHDFYTTTHLVNVGVGCGLLATKLRPNDRGFVETLSQGGLLHDVGKRDVPEEVLNKEGALTEEEWGLIRQHPMLGFTELVKCEGIAPEVLEMTRDHHERLDGTGYPSGRSGDELSLPTRICSVVDVFDALTAARPYRGPMPPANALQIMREGIGTQFDAEVFWAWQELLEELLRQDPARARPIAPADQFGSLGDYAAPRVAHGDDHADSRSATDANRRRFDRHPVSLSLRCEFARQLKRYPIGIGDPFTVRTVDISRSGLQIETPWPLAINDLLIVDLHTPKGVVRWRTRVARVRSSGNGWRAGLQLLGRVASDKNAA